MPALSTTEELADLLNEAADQVAASLTAPYPTPPTRSYLHPVLGPLAAGPQVAAHLSEQLDTLIDNPGRTLADLFALSSLASALGWYTESLTTLIHAVETICDNTGLPEGSPDSPPLPASTATAPHTLPLASVRAAAALCDIAPDRYAGALASALEAGARLDTECEEIAAGLREDAEALHSPENLAPGGPESLPHLVRALLSRTETVA
ncbi:putative anter-specific proline-rich protein APG [Streptomyces sp. Tu6071]|uniref:hypothetical protein n=1 Tax=Streptomyces sp. Tu6071 TaxID=355249 RepID=UPI00020E61DF|nr:hypothetical protein [Streptomyces sp. Tu6071]EGJ77929.1 putative anter-specific proline-rich protein APG [Streptomyces sp. Tu6071]